MQPLGADDGQAAVRIPQHQHRVRPDGGHQLVTLGDDVAHGFTQIGTYGIEINFRISQLQIMEEHAVQVIVVILPRVGKNHIEILTGFVDHRSKANDLRASTHNDEKFKLAIVVEGNVAVICHDLHLLKECIRMLGIKNLVAGHHGNQIFCIR